MIYKKYEHPNYNVIGIKNDKFKSCTIEVHFRKNILEHDLSERILLSDVMTFSSFNYPSSKSLSIKYQDLYNLDITSSVNKIGSCLDTSFSANFIAPKYLKDKSYLDSVIQMLFEIILHPNVKNNTFDSSSFNIIKNKLVTDINNLQEDVNRVAISGALKTAFKDTCTSYLLINEKDYVSDISSDKLYEIYKDMLNSDLCDIFIIGNLDIDFTNEIISKYFTNNVIKTNKVNLYANNKVRKKVLETCAKSNFGQSSLIMIYNLLEDNKTNLQITPYVFNNIFGNGSLNSKLFKHLREDNSLCYGVSCMYLRFDGLLIIKTSLSYSNISKAIKLINIALKEMIKGDFSNSELEDAKKSAIFSVKMSQDYIGSYLNNYIFNYYDDLPLPDDKIFLIKAITKEDITNFAKSLKLNSIYVLKEANNEEN